MNLGALILELQPLLGDPQGHWERIVELLDDHRHFAEYEVARFFVAKHVEPMLWEMAESVDPRRRLEAARALKLVFPRTQAAKLLRRLAKDPDSKVRTAASSSAGALGIGDVALPRKVSLRKEPLEWSAYGRAGWTYGLVSPWDPGPVPPADLASLGLPRLPSAKAVAKFVGLASEAELQRLLRPGEGPGAPYVAFEIPKPRGGRRRISAPRSELKRVQRALLDKLLGRIPVHDAAHGFVPGRSTVTNAAPHLGAKILIKVDLKDFFPSIHYRRVVGLFRYYGYKEPVARLLAGLCTHRPMLDDGTVVWPGEVPQGAPTSPALANIVSRRLDARLTGLAKRAGAIYTRYADDLTFSFHHEPAKGVGRFLWWIDQVCQQEGFAENAIKRRVLRQSNQQRVTGVVVNTALHVPRAARRRFRATLHNCRAHGLESQARGREDFASYLRGFAAYVRMVQPAEGDKLVAEVEELLEREGEAERDGVS